MPDWGNVESIQRYIQALELKKAREEEERKRTELVEQMWRAPSVSTEPVIRSTQTMPLSRTVEVAEPVQPQVRTYNTYLPTVGSYVEEQREPEPEPELQLMITPPIWPVNEIYNRWKGRETEPARYEPPSQTGAWWENPNAVGEFLSNTSSRAGGWLEDKAAGIGQWFDEVTAPQEPREYSAEDPYWNWYGDTSPHDIPAMQYAMQKIADRGELLEDRRARNKAQLQEPETEGQRFRQNLGQGFRDVTAGI
jgi:hypothetical protein